MFISLRQLPSGIPEIQPIDQVWMLTGDNRRAAYEVRVDSLSRLLEFVTAIVRARI